MNALSMFPFNVIKDLNVRNNQLFSVGFVKGVSVLSLVFRLVFGARLQ